MWAIEAMQVSPGGPDTHNNPHQRRAAQTAAKHLFYVGKKTVNKNTKSFPVCFLWHFMQNMFVLCDVCKEVQTKI